MRTEKKAAHIEDTGTAKLQATQAGLARFLEGQFGLSVHWGLYSLNGRGEWVYYNERIPLDVYRQRLDRFNPVRFDAEEWADLMVEAGQKLFFITTKHHDGFCLWDTPSTDWKITNTPFRRDVISELAIALRDRGIALHFYYSILDWTRPEYRSDWPAYVAYYQGHIRELCTRFGPIGGILFDGYWPRATFETADEQAYFPPRGRWDLAGTYDLIHSLQPGRRGVQQPPRASPEGRGLPGVGAGHARREHDRLQHHGGGDQADLRVVEPERGMGVRARDARREGSPGDRGAGEAR